MQLKFTVKDHEQFPELKNTEFFITKDEFFEIAKEINICLTFPAAKKALLSAIIEYELNIALSNESLIDRSKEPNLNTYKIREKDFNITLKNQEPSYDILFDEAVDDLLITIKSWGKSSDLLDSCSDSCNSLSTTIKDLLGCSSKKPGNNTEAHSKSNESSKKSLSCFRHFFFCFPKKRISNEAEKATEKLIGKGNNFRI